MKVELSIAEIAAICDALKWNVAKQSWLKISWKSRGDPVAANGHRLRQRQAENVLERLEVLLWGG